MGKRRVDKYAEKEVLKGKTHQEIFDYIVATSTFKIHDIAEIVRKVPTPAKRKKYRTPNFILIGMLVIGILWRTMDGIGMLNAGNRLGLINLILSPIVPCFFIYLVYNYKRNMHLVLAIMMLVGGLGFFSQSFSHLNVLSYVRLIFNLIGSAIAFYLHVKLPSDYEINKELQKSNPEQRENLITFKD